MPGAVGPVGIAGGSSVATATFSSAIAFAGGEFCSSTSFVAVAPFVVGSCVAAVGGGMFSLAGAAGATSLAV